MKSTMQSIAPLVRVGLAMKSPEFICLYWLHVKQTYKWIYSYNLIPVFLFAVSFKYILSDICAFWVANTAYLLGLIRIALRHS